MNLNRKLAAAGAAIVLAGAVFAYAAPGRHGGIGTMGNPGKRLEMLAGYLDLTDAQREKAKVLARQAMDTARPVLDQLKQQHEAMRAAVQANKPEAEITQLATTQGALVGQLIGIHAKAMAQFYSLLTPEQQQKADKLHDHFRDLVGHRFGITIPPSLSKSSGTDVRRGSQPAGHLRPRVTPLPSPSGPAVIPSPKIASFPAG